MEEVCPGCDREIPEDIFVCPHCCYDLVLGCIPQEKKPKIKAEKKPLRSNHKEVSETPQVKRTGGVSLIVSPGNNDPKNPFCPVPFRGEWSCEEEVQDWVQRLMAHGVEKERKLYLPSAVSSFAWNQVKERKATDSGDIRTLFWRMVLKHSIETLAAYGWEPDGDYKPNVAPNNARRIVRDESD